MKGLGWADYIAGHPERLPRYPDGDTWADVPRPEYRRVTHNWRRWRNRRLANTAKPLVFRYVVDADGTERVVCESRGAVAE